MTPDAHLAQLVADGPLLAAAARRAGWDAPVPATQWTVRELVTHVGGVHRWAAGIVRDCSATSETPERDAVGTGPGDAELLDWFRSGHAELVETLRTAPHDLACVTFLPASTPFAFWCRRQAHETAVHRADAEAAAGKVTPFDAEFAQDGIAEILLGFAARRSNAIARPGVVALRAEDGPHWRLTFGGERIVAVPDQAPDAGASVTGPSSELYLWLWNRPADVVIRGDESLAAEWRGVRVSWS